MLKLLKKLLKDENCYVRIEGDMVIIDGAWHLSEREIEMLKKWLEEEMLRGG